MEKSALEKAAALIAQHNLTPQVAGVRVGWDEVTAKLVVQYFVDGEVADDERELCELTLTELLAEFPDVRTADTQCIANPCGGVFLLDGIVFPAAVVLNTVSGWQLSAICGHPEGV
ncbi:MULTISPECIES: hypothetical protein [unclassified Achromobacter]|uniref:hypothetical protein n=1 Tax=unclassified Achromobacter TaxID=2626865 RepID=UPI000B750A67|nr:MULTISPECIES: hypothetical protein [unclassified Achromobacter]OWT73781.1 hypothetical protein CEY05_22120 [Achromobacter sp. HZ34]